MTSNRPYRGAISDLETLEELTKCSDTQFSPDLVKVFIRIMDKRNVEEMQEVGGRQNMQRLSRGLITLLMVLILQVSFSFLYDAEERGY